LFTLQVVHDDSEDEELETDETDTDPETDIVCHAAEFNVVTDCSSVVDIANHIQSNPKAYFDALETGIEYEDITSCQVTNANLHVDPTFLLIQQSKQ
jgi:hypothetical protein